MRKKTTQKTITLNEQLTYPYTISKKPFQIPLPCQTRLVNTQNSIINTSSIASQDQRPIIKQHSLIQLIATSRRPDLQECFNKILKEGKFINQPLFKLKQTQGTPTKITLL